MAALAPLLFVGLLLFVIGIWTSAANERRSAKLARIANELEGSHAGNRVEGKYSGLPVVYLLETRGGGSTSELWTYVDVALPRAYPLTIHVRRQLGSDRAKIAWGEMVDVEVGDQEFDPLFLVEAAPADVARALLDPEARGFLSSHGQVELDTRSDEAGGRWLRLAMRNWYEELPDAMTAIAATTRIAGRVREAFGAVQEAMPAADRGTPYRDQLEDGAARDPSIRQKDEVAHVEALRTRRAAAQRDAAIALFWVTFLTLGLLFLAALSR